VNPLVSVITVTWNSAPTIARAIESVLTQDYAPLEYIVIDGASTDGTVDIVRGYGERVTRFVSEKDGGIYSAMNKGLSLSSGSMILYINSDDLFAGPRALSSLVDTRRQIGSKDPTICYSDFIKHYPSLNRSLLMRANESFKNGFGLCHQAMLVDRSAYDLVGPFDTTFRYAADYDWTARAKRLGVRFLRANVPPTVIFRHGGASHSSYWSSWVEARRVILREYGHVAHFRYMARQYWVRFLRGLSAQLKNLFGARFLAALQGFYFRAVRGQHLHDQRSGK